MAPAISKPLLSDLEAQIGKVPSTHIRPVGDRPDLANVDNESGVGIPLIDLKKLNGPERPKVVEAIGRACEFDGFFMVTNHGIPAAVVEGMLRVAREFFHLPESERLKCYSDDPKKAIRLSTSFNVRTEKVLELLPVDLMDMSPAADIKRQERGASWISAAISSDCALTRWLRKFKFKLGGSSSSSLLPVVAPLQRQPAHWESHSPGTRGFAAGAPRPSSQRHSSAAAESTSILVSEIPLGDSGSFPPPPSLSLSSASSSPSRDTATRTPFSTTGENAAPDATGSEEPVRARRSGSPPELPAPAADPEDALKVFVVNIGANITLLVNIKDISSSWKTEWKLLYGVFVLLCVLWTVTSIYAAWSHADSWARTFSSLCARLGLLVATALFVVNTTCQLGPFGCVAGVPAAALFVLFLAVVWWKS